MRRVGSYILAVLALALAAQTASAQAVVRPPEFFLIRPSFPPPKPYVMSPINVQPIKQQQPISTNNNPQPITFRPLRQTAVVRQGITRQNSNFATQLYQPYQPGGWIGSPSTIPATSASQSAASSSASSGRRQSLGW